MLLILTHFVFLYYVSCSIKFICCAFDVGDVEIFVNMEDQDHVNKVDRNKVYFLVVVIAIRRSQNNE